MATDTYYPAPWPRWLYLSSGVIVVLMLGIAAAGVLSGPQQFAIWWLSMVGLPLLTLLFAALFVVRGYRIEGNSLLARRLLWDSRLPLDGLREVRADPQAMARSLRLFGNGGLFVVSGLYRNAQLGKYRAWVNDPTRAVVLRFDQQCWVISPDRPEAFAASLRQLRRLPG